MSDIDIELNELYNTFGAIVLLQMIATISRNRADQLRKNWLGDFNDTIMATRLELIATNIDECAAQAQGILPYECTECTK